MIVFNTLVLSGWTCRKFKGLSDGRIKESLINTLYPGLPPSPGYLFNGNGHLADPVPETLIIPGVSMESIMFDEFDICGIASYQHHDFDFLKLYP